MGFTMNKILNINLHDVLCNCGVFGKVLVVALENVTCQSAYVNHLAFQFAHEHHVSVHCFNYHLNIMYIVLSNQLSFFKSR